MMTTRLLQIQKPSPTRGTRPVAMGRSSGFTVFWFLAAVVFVVTFAGVLTLKYQAANGTSPTFAGTDSNQQKIEMPLADPANTTPAATRPAEQARTSDERTATKSLLAGFFGDADEPVTAGAQCVDIRIITGWHRQCYEQRYLENQESV